MTSDELALRSDTDSWVEILGPVGDLAGKIARTEFVPKGLQGNAAGVAAAILTGREMGLGPMASLRGIHIVEGRPSLSSEMLAARILAAGHRIEWKGSTDKACTVRIERSDGLSEAEVTWTMADAQRAGLAGKQVWQKYPRHMLRWRTLSEAADMVCPDVSMGLDVIAASAPDVTSQSPAPSTVVQVATQTDPAPIPAPRAPVDEPQPAEPEPEPELISPAQMRKIGALIGEWEHLEHRTLDRTERRRLIGHMAGVDDPNALASAKDLTKTQASEAIDSLHAAIEVLQQGGDEVVDAELVDDTTPAQETP